MSSLLKTYNPSDSVFARPKCAHEFNNKETYKGFNNNLPRTGGNDNKKYPSLINGKQVNYKQA